MHQAEIIVLLFALVAVLAVLACKVALPYPIVLVIGGPALMSSLRMVMQRHRAELR